MKKLNYLLAGAFALSLLLSCEKEKVDNQWNDHSKSGKKSEYVKSAIGNIENTPVSDNGVIPYIIPGINRGGNRTCEEVATAFGTTFDLCGTKLNYGDFDVDGDYEFDGNFPGGLNVTVEGNFISFDATGCLSIGGENYKVGAVIVKGASDANVYFYENGTLSDGGLAAPGGLHMVSNLTFCFYKCENPQLVIAFKTQVTGSAAWTVVDGYTLKTVDYYNLVNGYNGKIYLQGNLSQPLGNITVDDIDSDGLLEVLIDNYDMTNLNFIFGSHLFVGSLADYLACITPYQFPFQQTIYSDSQTLIYELPF